jgi:aldose 1-epimerase
VGRVAGRISGARFALDGHTYALARNDGPNHLHGGREGFDKKVWAAEPVEREDAAPSLRLTYCSLDGEEGYPGTVDVTVTYTVTNDDALLIETEAASDRATPLSLTHHSYFNLGGEGNGSVADHELQIFAARYLVADERMTLVGREEAAAGRGHDFRQPQMLGEVIPALFQNHGDLYRLRGTVNRDPASQPVLAARLAHPKSGRILQTLTTATHLQLYTGAALDGSLVGKSGVPYVQYAGACFECEGYPDGANKPELGDIILRPGEKRRESTAYVFSVTS